MNVHKKEGIIPRVPGPIGIMVGDVKRVFSHLWQGSHEVIAAIEGVKKGILSPEEALELFFGGGSNDPILRCFLVLVKLNNEATLELLDDLRVVPKHDCVYEDVSEAYDWFFKDIYAKQKVCSGRRDQGRKEPRSTA
ncbi:MAG: hypothetical protein HZB09_02645 [Candidatus Yonathbacteria bacterium]|nr:hypothetical protein [Candidatus Yonathbacteria bacterium]